MVLWDHSGKSGFSYGSVNTEESHEDEVFNGQLQLLPAPGPSGEPDLMLSVRRGNLGQVLDALGANADPNERDMVGETPLFEAAGKGNIDIVAALLCHSADPRKKSHAGNVAGDFARDKSVRLLIALFRGVKLDPTVQEDLMFKLTFFLRRAVIQEITALKRLGSFEDVETVESDNVVGDALVLSPLQLAVQSGEQTAVMRLLQEGQDPNQVDVLGETPLFECVARDDVNMATALLLASADPEHKSLAGTSPEDFAISAAVKSILQLCSGKQLSSSEESSAMCLLSDKMRSALLRKLGTQGKNKSTDFSERAEVTVSAGAASLPSACKHQPENLAALPTVAREKQATKEAYADVSTDAVANGRCTASLELQCDCIQPEIDKDAETSAGLGEVTPGLNPVCKSSLVKLHASNHQPQDIGEVKAKVGTLHSHRSGASMQPLRQANSQDPEALLLAVQGGTFTDVIKCLDLRADPNAVDVVGESSLFEAAARGNNDVVAALLLHAADPAQQSPYGTVPSDMAASASTKTLLHLFRGVNCDSESGACLLNSLTGDMRSGVQKKLQEHHPEPSLMPDQGPLIAATQAGDFELVIKLLKDGVDPNENDALGETPLFEAALNGNANITAALLLYTADPSYRSPAGVVAADYAADAAVQVLFRLFADELLDEDTWNSLSTALNATMHKAVNGRMLGIQMKARLSGAR